MTANANLAQATSLSQHAPFAQPAAAVPALELRAVAKGYGSGAARTEVLDGIDLAVGENEFVAIVGFSGSGKTTLVNLLAGLTEPDAGAVLKRGTPVRGPGPDRGVVFQSYSLMPWLTVKENVALAVDCVFAARPREERRARVARYIEMVGLTPAAYKRPAELSGGMRQRVAVARALAANPDVLLLDEPLSALDALTRAKLQDEIIRIWNEEQKTGGRSHHPARSRTARLARTVVQSRHPTPTRPPGDESRPALQGIAPRGHPVSDRRRRSARS
jgi:nitrate/nitrite transport system ATP-binding protein